MNETFEPKTTVEALEPKATPEAPEPKKTKAKKQTSEIEPKVGSPDEEAERIKNTPLSWSR